MVGATEVIVGNAPMELRGVAGGLQQAAMQVGGASAPRSWAPSWPPQISTSLPEHLGAAAGTILPDQLAGLEKAAAFGGLPPGLPAEFAQVVGPAVSNAFMDGMHLAFLVSTGVALLTAVLALFVKSGRKIEDAPLHVG